MEFFNVKQNFDLSVFLQEVMTSAFFFYTVYRPNNLLVLSIVGTILRLHK